MQPTSSSHNGTPLTKSVTVIIYATYSRDLEIDEDKVLTEAF